jgi:hypothetical protein
VRSSSGAPRPVVACFATQGPGSGDHERLLALLGHLSPEELPFDRSRKLSSALRLLARLQRRRPEVVVMEGTGVAGGAALLLARLVLGMRYVVSSGDAVAPYLASRRPWLRPIAYLYERALCRFSAGFIGWSPYLAGRALTLGAPRAMTAANWAPATSAGEPAAVREELGIPANAVVFGLVGSLDWNPRLQYCYGAELVRSLSRTERPDVRVLVVGDGSGRAQLAELAGEQLGRRVILPGRIPRERVPDYLAAIDVASLPQSVDGVGSFRYTTKLSEYLAAGLPVATGQIPLAYDLDDGWLWRMPGDAPWDERYVGALTELMESLSLEEVARRRELVPRALPAFELARQRRQVGGFVADILAAHSR